MGGVYKVSAQVPFGVSYASMNFKPTMSPSATILEAFTLGYESINHYSYRKSSFHHSLHLVIYFATGLK